MTDQTSTGSTLTVAFQRGQRGTRFLLITFLTTWVMRTRPAATTNEGNAGGEWPMVAQQHADALSALVTEGGGTIDTEVIVHVRGDGNTLDDGTPLPDGVVAGLIPTAFISALVHDAKDNPIDATNRRRHPNRRQKRLVKERDQTCIDCARHELLEYDDDSACRDRRSFSSDSRSEARRTTRPRSPPNSNSGAHPATTTDTPKTAKP